MLNKGLKLLQNENGLLKDLNSDKYYSNQNNW